MYFLVALVYPESQSNRVSGRLGSAGLTVGLDGLKGLFHLDDSVFYATETLFYSAQAHFSENNIILSKGFQRLTTALQ